MMLEPLNYNTLSNMFRKGEFDQIFNKAEKYLAIFPADIKILTIIGQTYLKLKRYQKALIIYKSIRDNIPDDNKKFQAETEYNIGCIYAKRYDFKSALQHFLTSRTLDNHFEPNYVTLALSLKNLQKFHFAKHVLLKGVNIFPNSVVIKYNLANLLQDFGDFDQAESLYKTIINNDLQHTKAHYEYSRLKTYSVKDKHISQMRDAIKTANSTEDKSYLSFALGNAYAKLKSYKKAYSNWSEGNAYFRSNINFDIKREAAQFKEFKSWYGNIKFKENSDDPKLCFIVGMPRSGTSLTEQILSGHSQVFGAGELTFLEEGIIRTHNKNELVPNFIDIRNHYFNRLRMITKTQKLVTDKNPLNFRWIGIIKTCFPNAKIIHIHRHPKSVCFSVFKHLFPVGCHFSFNLDDIFSYYDLYQAHMRHWNALYDDIINLSYEDLTDNPERKIKYILSACGLDFEKQCIEIEKNKRVVQTISNSQIRTSIKQIPDETLNYYHFNKEFKLKFDI